MKESDQHVSPIKNWKQLVVVVVLAFLIPIVVILLITQLVTGGLHGGDADESAVLARIKPVGEFKLAPPGSAAESPAATTAGASSATAAGAPATTGAAPTTGTLSGEQVYGRICNVCHDAGVAGAPKIGDKASWGPRIAQGEKTLDQHAIAGFQGKVGVMPPRGGKADLADIEVERAVAFMANRAGEGFKEPGAK